MIHFVCIVSAIEYHNLRQTQTMTLETWMRQHGENYETLAEQLGVGRTTTRYWCEGKRRPNTKNTIKIAAFTHGAVTPDDLHQVAIRSA
jgi:DNA-binding transcriptional regulator YdaS (Cro superfamily)